MSRSSFELAGTLTDDVDQGRAVGSAALLEVELEVKAELEAAGYA